MALYEFHCPECTSNFDLRRPMAEADDLAPCPECGSLLTERVFTAPAIAGRANAPVETATSNGKRKHAMGCPCC